MNKKIKISNGDFKYSYGISSVLPDDLNMRHCHDTYEILYVIEGEGKFVIEGNEYPMHSHSLVVIPPLEYHYVEVVPGTSYERCVIRFKAGDILPECRDYLSSFPGSDSGVFYISEMTKPVFTALIEQFEYSDTIPAEKKKTYLSILLSELLLLLSSVESESPEQESIELGARVIRYLNENIMNDVSLDRLAKRFFVSKYYLCRAFKKHNGISIHGYINQKRVMYAKQLIEDGESASGAAYKVGFGDYSAFYRAYVKIVGRSPTAAT